MPVPVRARVLGFAFLLAVITYLDRVCISAAAPYIMDDLHLSVLQMSVVFSAFTLSYSLFEIPSGWLGDVKGPRSVLTRIVLWWSAFTMLTAAARGFASLVVIRFLFGAGEAGAFPNIARSFSRWFPARERGRANGVMFLGSRMGGMLSAPIALLIVVRWGWRTSFVVFGLLGVVWAAAWYAWYRDRPEEHPAVSREELAWIQQDGNAGDGHTSGAGTPWRALVRSRNLYAICAMYFAFGYGLYFYFTWLPTYLIKVLGFSLLSGGIFAALPFLLAGIADLVGGWLTDHLSKRHGLRVGRCHLGFAAFLTCALLVFSSTLPIPADRQSAAARAGARVRRPRARRVLGGAARHRARPRRGRHRLHEHARQSRRPARSARRRLRRGPLALVDVSVLHHGAGLRRRRARVAGDRSDTKNWRLGEFVSW